MSAIALTYAEAKRIVREADMRDKRYRAFPIGQEIGRFKRAKRLAGRRPGTLDLYERVLSRLALDFPDFPSLEPFCERESGSEHLLDFIDTHWGDSAEETLRNRMDILASFFDWAFNADRIPFDPMRKLQRPKVRKRGARRPSVPDAHVARLVGAQESLRDQACLLLLGRMALRHGDLRLLQLGDIDLARDDLYLRHGKGGEEDWLPILYVDVRDTLYLHLQERQGHPDEYLLYPKRNRTVPMSSSGLNAWFRRCAERAGLTGYSPHMLRHSALDWLMRETRDIEATKLLARHKDIATTQLYLHTTVDDLRRRLSEVSSLRVGDDAREPSA